MVILKIKRSDLNRYGIRIYLLTMLLVSVNAGSNLPLFANCRITFETSGISFSKLEGWTTVIYKEEEILGINRQNGTSATAAYIFDEEKCIYNFSFEAIKDTSGPNYFTFLVNSHFLETITVPALDTLSAGEVYTHTIYNLPLEPGDTITIIGKITEDFPGTIQARWRKISFRSLPPPCEGASFEEINGLAVMEMEDLPLSQNWAKENVISGGTGSGYILWKGDQYFNQTGVGRIKTKVKITHPGSYRFNWRVAVALGEDRTEHNDSWLKISGDQYFGERSNGTQRVKPRPECTSTNGFECPAGSSRNGFFKIYGGGIRNFVWQARTSDSDPHLIYTEFNEPGIYDLEINARSSFHAIDRMVLHRVNEVTVSTATNVLQKSTLCSPGPPLDLTFVVGDGTQPLSGANITTTQGIFTTDLMGRVTIEELPEGEFTFQITLAGYQTFNDTLILTQDQTVVRTLSLQTATDQKRIDNPIILYPNPTGNFLHLPIELFFKTYSRLEYSVFSLDGKKLQSGYQEENQAIDVRSLAPGTYLISITNSGQMYQCKFVKI